jgi:hypothetical protein
LGGQWGRRRRKGEMFLISLFVPVPERDGRREREIERERGLE